MLNLSRGLSRDMCVCMSAFHNGGKKVCMSDGTMEEALVIYSI